MRCPHLACLLAIFTLSIPAPATAAAEDDAQPDGAPDAAALAEGWFRQHHGFDSLEAYELRGGSVHIEFGLARKWINGAVSLLLDFNKPTQIDELMLLFLQRRHRSDDLFVYLSPRLFPASVARRVRRLHVGALNLGIPAASRFVQIGDFRPFLPGELRHESAAPIEIEGEPCYVVESRPVDAGRFPFDRLELALSRRTGVALRTRHYRGDLLLREVYVSPDDVAAFDGRWLPVRQQIEVSGQPIFDLTLQNIDPDPELPDGLFTSRNLIAQRFPGF